METIKENGEYRLVEGYGQYFNKRYEVQKKYSYWENNKKVYGWCLEFHSENLQLCIEAYNRRVKE